MAQNLAVLAAYEATVGPVLGALVGIKVKNNPVKKGSRTSRKKRKDKDGRKPGEVKVGVTGALPRASSHRRQSGDRNRNAQFTSENRSSGFQSANTDPAVLPTPLQTDCVPKPPEHNTDAFEKLERQALRRRKVEALESLAHTAALFLAEFMNYNKGRQEPATNTSSALESGQDQTGLGVGAAYAAAAAAGITANVFQSLSEEIEHSGYSSSASGMEQSSSSSGSSDDEDIPSRVPSGSTDDMGMDMDMDMDESGSDEMRSKMSASFRNEEDADDVEPEVKVEHR
ncbi:hypothetical protein Daus18300_002663 [Diaporthe australafricana]|uniref:Uncharacterized protein n=1 Tax=Diaporthe australafricana TaxID=127596 RepID=A0ABR3XM37_9PEZI